MMSTVRIEAGEQPRRSPFRGHVRFNLPDGTASKQKLPSGRKLKIGAKCTVMMVWPKGVPVEKQHLIVVWFERVKGGWWPRGGSE